MTTASANLAAVVFGAGIDQATGRSAKSKGSGQSQDAIAEIRERVAEIAEGYLGSEEFAKEAVFGAFRQGSNKCNCFVEHVLNLAGIQPPMMPSGEWPLTANGWANTQHPIPGWVIVTTPMRGDVAAVPRSGDDGHVGIYVGGSGRTVIGAGALEVGYSTTHFLTGVGMGFLRNASGPIVYRRYVGSGK